MNNKGITLIELLVVIAIIAVLAVALGFSFQGWQGGYRIESQVKEIHVDLMNARARAMQRNRVHFVVVNAGNYQIFEDTNENNAYNAGIDLPIQSFATAKPLEYQALSVVTVTMDTKGLVLPDATTISFNIGTNTPDYDCITLETTRINIGLMTRGVCEAK